MVLLGILRGQAKRLMKAWGGEHEARYRDEVKLLRMVTAKEHVGASEYAQLVSGLRYARQSNWVESIVILGSGLFPTYICTTRVGC